MQDQLARIAAMITNEDQNVGRLMAHLTKHASVKLVEIDLPGVLPD